MDRISFVPEEIHERIVRGRERADDCSRAEAVRRELEDGHDAQERVARVDEVTETLVAEHLLESCVVAAFGPEGLAEVRAEVEKIERARR